MFFFRFIFLDKNRTGGRWRTRISFLSCCPLPLEEKSFVLEMLLSRQEFNGERRKLFVSWGGEEE